MRRIEIAVVVGAMALSASACGGSSTDVAEGAGSGTDASSASPTLAAETTSPTEAPSISPAHAAEPGEPELIQVEGYEYSSVDGMTEKQMQEMVAGLSLVYAGYSAHVVSQDGEPVGMMALLSLTPEGADMANQDPETMLEGTIEGMIGSAGSGAYDVVTISGEDVWTGEGEGAVAYAWLHADALSMFVGVDPEAAEAFLTAYLAEANG